MKTKRSTFATSFYIKRSAVRNRDGKAPIMVKISIDGDDKALGTKLFVTPDLWENGKAKGKSAEATEINGQLKEVSARLKGTVLFLCGQTDDYQYQCRQSRKPGKGKL